MKYGVWSLLALVAAVASAIGPPPTAALAWHGNITANGNCNAAWADMNPDKWPDGVVTHTINGVETWHLEEPWNGRTQVTFFGHIEWSTGESWSGSATAYKPDGCVPPEVPPEEPPEEEPPAIPPGPIWTAECVRTVRGRVLDRFNKPVPNIGVAWDGEDNIVTFTDAEGNYGFDFTPPGEHTITVLWEEYNQLHGTSLFFSRPSVTVVVGDECLIYPADDLVDPVVQVRTTQQSQPATRPSLAELRFIRFLEGWELSGPSKI